VAERQEHLLREVVDLRRGRAEPAQASIDVIELALEGIEAFVVARGGRRGR